MVEAWVAPPWIDKIALEIMVQKNMDKTGNFDPYFKQVGTTPIAGMISKVEGNSLCKQRAVMDFSFRLRQTYGTECTSCPKRHRR